LSTVQTVRNVPQGGALNPAIKSLNYLNNILGQKSEAKWPGGGRSP